MIGGRNRRVHRQPEATSAGEDARVPCVLAVIRECVNELGHLFPEPFPYLSIPPPRPSRREAPPVSRRSIAAPPLCFPRVKKKENVSVWSLTSGPHCQSFKLFEPFSWSILSVYFSIGNRQILVELWKSITLSKMLRKM